MEKKMAMFLVKFSAIFMVLQAALYTAELSLLEEPLAALEGRMLNLQVRENTVLVGEHGYVIDSQCTGLVSASILAAVVFSIRRPGAGKKTAIFLAGTTILLAANIARVYAVLASAVKFGPATAEAVHVLSWFTTTALIILVWYYLTKRVTGVKEFHELL